ncbi:carboxy-S-adenosyl-L-methionine synthase CmoA [Desulfurivibrio alkaliphilus]|uniref:Carboxy-S-adenosyl-L-methionine synthase n=1 Tax=Desulfurivibrio alkaliphilus (strain DSM 19089 / UNIQEM U267 / AHT2) TaxID=589865 RepID=D6Z2Y7_DESAT|nr:carboxy-S-adenosyl-L-methionine synthase CmoA [Desulfurivibrio alkaliphilus]ADH85912.1 methyltransferase [Desulfurivibrio alkaliphilus AHT 2]
MPKDQLFNHGKVASDFRFTAEVAEVFDDMLRRSIPNYEQVIEMNALLLECFLRPGDRLYDLGCSTGNTLLHLARRLQIPELRLIGVDNSAAMLDKARRKAAGYAPGEAIEFVEGDIGDFNGQNAGAIILNYTMQFIRPLQRPDFAATLYRALRPGGILIMSEKIISHDPELNRHFIDFYFDFKRSRGYSEIEISKKREALENVLIPFSLAENRQLLEQAGFKRVESVFQWFNFASLVAVK